MSQDPPPIYSNYPRQSTAIAWPVRPPNVYIVDGLGDAWSALTAQLSVWLPIALIIGVAYAIFAAVIFAAMLPLMAEMNAPGSVQVIQIIVTLAEALPYTALVCLLAGALATGVRQFNGEVIDVRMIFSGFKRFGALFVLTAIHCVFSALVQFAAGRSGLYGSPEFNPRALIIVGVGWLVGVFVYWTLVYPLVLFVPADLVINPDRSFRDAVGEAYRRAWTLRLAFKFLLLGIISALLFFTGECLCFVGLLFSGPMVILLYALHYRYFYPPVINQQPVRQVSIGDLPPE